jgi:VWFA-related protein
VLSGICAVLGLSLVGQSQQAPVFRAGVDLVAVDAVVVDRDGYPVPGLTPTDFLVEIDGQRRAVRTLEYRRFGTPEPQGTPAALSSNAGVRDALSAYAGGRVVLLLFDDLAAKPGEAKALLVAAERVLTALGSDDLLAVATTSGLGPVLTPTRDRGLVVAALHSRSLVGLNTDTSAPFFITRKEALEIAEQRRGALRDVSRRECDVSTQGPSCIDLVEGAAKRLAILMQRRSAEQIAAYRNAIDALLAVPTPRVLIALSAGVAFSSSRSEREDFDAISRSAAEASVQFYAVTEPPDSIDIRAVGRPLPGLNDRVTAGRLEGQYLNDGVKTLAHAAGGEAFAVVGQADRFFKRILSETSALYVLGVEIPAPRLDQRFLDVKVSIDRPGVTIRTRRHALVPGTLGKPIPVEEALRMRVAQGGFAFGVPLRVATALRKDPGGGIQMAVEAQVPSAVNGPLVAMFAALDEQGRVVQSGRREIPAGRSGEDYRIAFPVPLKEGTYRLRLAIADANGNIGSVQQRVIAELRRVGSLLVSDVLTTWATSDGQARLLALDLLPAHATSLRAVIELYPDDPGGGSPVKVRFTLRRGEEPAPIASIEASTSVNGTALVATATLPAGALAPGAYTIDAEILDAGRVLGVVSTSLRKAG